MDDRTQELAPISNRAWEEIEEQARSTLTTHLSARKLVDVSGPHGWDRSAANPGRVDFVDESPAEGVRAGVRQTRPLVELRAPFELDRHELERIDRGGDDPELEHVEQILDGPIVWAPALAGAMILSLRGGDFELVLGRDISLGFDSHDAESVELYLEESVTFRLLGPEAAVALEPVG